MDDAPTFDAERLLAHAGWARALARRLVLDEQRADDLVQQAWLAALRRPPADASSARSWLGRVIRNVAWKERRGESRRASREQAAAAAEPQPSAATLVAELSAQRLVVDALVRIDEPYRETLVRRWYRDEKPAAIARAMGVPVKTVETRLARGLERLRAELTTLRGDRRTWAVALVPLAARAPIGIAAATGAVLGDLAAGVALMSSSMKLASVAALALAAAAVLWAVHAAAPSSRAAVASNGAAASNAAAAVADERGRERPAAAAPEVARAPEARSTSPDDAEARAPDSMHVHCVDADGAPVTGARLVMFRGDAVLGTALADGGGADLPVAASAAELIVDPPFAAPFRTVVPADVRLLELALPRGAVLSGVAIVPARRRGEPLVLRFSASDPFPAFRELSRAVAAAVGGSDGLRRDVVAPLDEQDRFRVCGLAPAVAGTLVAPEGFSFEPITRSADGEPGRAITKEIERPQEGLELELFALPSLTGRLLDPQGRPSQLHEALTEGRAAGGGFTRRDPVCSANGLFRIPLEMAQIESIRIEFRSEMLPDWKRLELAPPLDEGRDLGDVVLASPHEMFVWITDSTGRRLDQPVVGIPAQEGWTRALLNLNAGGWMVPADVHELIAAAFGFRARRIALAGDGAAEGTFEHPIEVALEKATELRVRVRAIDGTPARDVKVELLSSPALLRGEPELTLRANELVGGSSADCVGVSASEWKIRLDADPAEGASIADLEPGVPFRLRVIDSLGSERFATELTLAPRESREVIATLTAPARTLRGRVVDESGAAVVGAFVTADAGADLASATTADDGSFAIDGLFVDAVHVRVSLVGFEALEVPKLAVRGDGAGELLVLRRSWPLTIVLVDSTGAKIDEAEVVARRREAPASSGAEGEAWSAGLRGRGIHRFDDLPSIAVIVTVVYAGRRFEREASPPTAELRVVVPQGGRARVSYDLPIPEQAAKGRILTTIALEPVDGGSAKGAGTGAAIEGTLTQFPAPRRTGAVEFPIVLPGRYAIALVWCDDEGTPISRQSTGKTLDVVAGQLAEVYVDG